MPRSAASSTAATADTRPAAGAGSTENGKAGKCRTDDLEITAIDSTIGNAGPLSAKRSGEHPGPAVLKKGAAVSFGVNCPLNTSGGSGVRITGLVVTPPDETKSVTLTWPGAATLPVTDGSGSPVKVGPIGSAGQGG
ncbi:hypothetical protein [Streptomyces sp. NPDC012746]|uniref:hypothetical protein n=1 Tax=Streptomyces sp. NPDC012746 TaxID=3364845 RepID=UPI0036772830